MIHVDFRLRATSLDPLDTREKAEAFCEFLKREVLGVPGLAAHHQIQAEVEYTVSEVDAVPATHKTRELRNLLNRAAAALETPKDLRPAEVEDLLADLVSAADQLSED